MFIFPDNYCNRKGNHCRAINLSWCRDTVENSRDQGGGPNLECDNLTETSILLTCVLTNLRCGHKVSSWPNGLKLVALYQTQQQKSQQYF